MKHPRLCRLGLTQLGLVIGLISQPNSGIARPLGCLDLCHQSLKFAELPANRTSPGRSYRSYLGVIERPHKLLVLAPQKDSSSNISTQDAAHCAPKTKADDVAKQPIGQAKATLHLLPEQPKAAKGSTTQPNLQVKSKGSITPLSGRTPTAKSPSSGAKEASEKAIDSGKSTQEQSKSQAVKTPVQAEKQSLKNAKSPKTTAKDTGHLSKSHVSKGDQFVPPPPAIQPSYLLNPDLGALPFQFDLMSKEAVSQRLKDINKQLADAKSQLADKIAQMKEKKEKFARFGPLYDEGVVSRHELEAAGKEASEAEKDLDKFKGDLAQLESESTLLSQRLKPAKKSTKQIESKKRNNWKHERN